MNIQLTDTAHTPGQRRLASPGKAIMLLACGHTAWGAVAYRRSLREILRSGVADSVGDGIFRTAHSDDGRAAAFWFLFGAPMMALTGYLTEAASRSEDRRTLTVTGRTILGIGAVGSTMMPRSGFPAVLPIGCWLMRRGRRPPQTV